MSYLLDKKIQRKKFLLISFFVIFLAIFFYFRSPLFRALSYTSHFIFHPVLILGQSVGGAVSNTGSFFVSKDTLVKENENLKLQLSSKQAVVANYDALLEENTKLKEILNRKVEKSEMVLASILSKPNQSLYGTLIIDAGQSEGLREGQTIFALGNIPIGRVAEVNEYSSKVILFSNPGEKTEAVISGKDIFMQLVGRGGGNFEMALQKDMTLPVGTELVLPGAHPYLVATVKAVVSDPRDSFVKALLASPVNVGEIKFVEVEK